MKCMLAAALLATAAIAASMAHADVDNTSTTQPSASTTSTPPNETLILLTITGGHDTDPRDRGRPIILIAAALGVPPQTFRDAFSNVHPAGPNRGPTPEEARANKQALMTVLAPLGITNDRLDEVSNYYRYNRSAGEMWKHTNAQAVAHIQNGKITSIEITIPGAGYTSTPNISIPNFPDAKFTATLTYTQDFSTNGSITSIRPTP